MLLGNKATMKAAALSILISLPLASCQHPRAKISPPFEDTCGAYRLSDFIGSQDNATTRDNIDRELGLAELSDDEWATTNVKLRYVKVGEPILADYWANRINVMVDKSDQIYALSCG